MLAGNLFNFIVEGTLHVMLVVTFEICFCLYTTGLDTANVKCFARILFGFDR